MKKMDEKLITINGLYEKTLYRNEKTGYTVFSLSVKRGTEHRSMYGTINCVATIPVYTKGMPLEVYGAWETKKHGITFITTSVKEYINDKEISISYLSTNLCKGIGKSTATAIVETYGPDIFELIQKDNAVDLLKKIKNITEEKAINLIISIRNTISQRQLFEYISKFGGSYTSSIKIAEEYGYLSIQTLKNNPYKIGKFGGLSFEMCDSIAKECGFNHLSSQRIEALIYEALDQLTSSGNTYTTQQELNNIIKKIIKNSAFHNKISPVIVLTYLTKMKGIIIERTYNKENKIYPKRLWLAEKNSITEINRLNNHSNLPFNDYVVNYAERICNIKYGNLQKEVFNAIKTTGIKIITGGPGTGKTTTIKGIIAAYKKLNPLSKVVLCAPTGRAAQRLKESTGYEAFTVHKLLEYRPFGREVSHKDSTNPIDADFIIVDEFSMIDIEIFSILLNAIKNNALVFLVGDKDQLPSVGPGNVMSDLINSKKIDLYKLDTVFRQGEGSNIIINAQKIREGDFNLINDPHDFEIIKVDDSLKIMEKLDEIIINANETDPFYMQVLTSTKKNEVGTVELNQDLQDLLNSSNQKMVYGNMTFKKGDKIIMTQNNYESGYYNGDIGIIKDIDDDGITLDINNDIIYLKRKNFEDISLAYAITIHKSQGSEFPVVIIILPKNPSNMLQRNLIFTAITRAREKVIIITEEDALVTSILRTNIMKRNTGLLSKILNVNSLIIPQRKKENLNLI